MKKDTKTTIRTEIQKKKNKLLIMVVEEYKLLKEVKELEEKLKK